MRIVHFINNLNFGGLQTVVMALSAAQKQQGHFVEIACLREPGNNPIGVEKMAAAGIRVVGPFRNFAGSVVTKTVQGVTRYLKEQQFDIVHSHNPFCAHYATAAARLARIPSVNTLHATAMFPRMQTQDRALFWGSAILNKRVVSVCSEVQDTLREWFMLPAGKLAVVENGADLSPFLSVPRRSAHEEVVFGTVGRMTAVKDHRGLLKAFALALSKYPQIRLRLLGGGPLEDELRQLAQELKIADRVEFHGFSANPAAFLAELDVFVLSSVSEGLPMSLLEAIASGLPVVSTPVGAVPDVISKTSAGWLSASHDPQALADALESAVQCPDRLEKGETARRLVKELYSSARMSADYQRVYETISKGI